MYSDRFDDLRPETFQYLLEDYQEDLVAHLDEEICDIPPLNVLLYATRDANDKLIDDPTKLVSDPELFNAEYPPIGVCLTPQEMAIASKTIGFLSPDRAKQPARS